MSRLLRSGVVNPLTDPIEFASLPTARSKVAEAR